MSDLQVERIYELLSSPLSPGDSQDDDPQLLIHANASHRRLVHRSQETKTAGAIAWRFWLSAAARSRRTLSHRRFASDQNGLGTNIRINQQVANAIGVMVIGVAVV